MTTQVSIKDRALLSVLVVNWNSKELVLRCLKALKMALDPARDEVIVVDNASTDGSAAAIASEHPWVTLIANERNRGYAHANNQAFARSRGEFVLLLNPDAEVRPDALAIMLAELQVYPTGGAITARLEDEDGTERRYFRAFPTLANAALAHTFARKLLPGLAARVVRRYRMEDADFSMFRTVPQPPGACLMLRRSAIQGKLMDERFPLYFNDVDLCRRIWAGGYEIFYAPQAIIVHIPNLGGLRRAGPELEIEYASSMLRYFRKYHSLPQYLLLYIALLSHYVFGFVASLFMRLLGRQPFPAFQGSLLRGLRLLLQLARQGSFFDGGAPPWA